MAPPHKSVAASQREWLNSVLEQTGYTATGLAGKIGVAPSTFTRFLANAQGSPKTLHAATIERVVAATGISPSFLPRGERAQVLSRIGDDVAPYSPPEDRNIAAGTKALLAARPNSRAYLVRSRAVESDGIVPGDIVIVETGEDPRAGDIVVAENTTRRRVELLLRVYEPPYLMAATGEPSFRRPIVVDGVEVRVIGFVTEILRGRRR
jgi:SOS-response transcriptional repressor LexA